MQQSSDYLVSGSDRTKMYFGIVAPAATQTWYTWNKPTNCTFVHLYCVGGGAGGGGGGASAAATIGGGGGGGGNGAPTSIIYPAHMIPDTLYVCPGSGGRGGTGQVQGGAAATAGVIGGVSAVARAPTLTDFGQIFCLAAAGPIGNFGSGATEGAASAVSVGYVNSGLLLHVLGSATAQQGGVAGSAGGASGGAGGNQGTWLSALTRMSGTAGAGGGGVNAGTTTTAGGTQPISGGLNTYPLLAGGIAGGGAGTNGDSYYGTTNYVRGARGGSGGGGNTSTLTGGRGGDGGPGCGGGGGGGTNGAASVGGAGGNGGVGVCIITCW